MWHTNSGSTTIAIGGTVAEGAHDKLGRVRRMVAEGAHTVGGMVARLRHTPIKWACVTN